jgi:hypothetical protein
MISRTWSRKPMVLCLAVAILSVYSMVALATPERPVPSGMLSVFGRVTVNGQSADCGTTIYSDSTIHTSSNSSATIALGSLGFVELNPNSSIKLSFTETHISGVVDAGQVRINTPAGISANITTKDGSAIASSSNENSFTLDVTCGATVVGTHTGNVEFRSGNNAKQIAAGSQDAMGQAAPGQRCTQVRVREVRRLYPRCTRRR